MPGQTPGPIQIVTGKYSNECVQQYDLVANSASFPQIRDFMEYVQTRQITTLITSGAVGPYGINYKAPTNIPSADTKSEGKGIGSNAYQWRIMGRIEKTAPIVGQVGASGADGTFTLKMLDDTLNVGDNPVFYGGRKTARVMAKRGQTAGGWLYDFATPNREVFSYATWVEPQSGTKYCFAGWTTYGEKSLRGYGYSKFPDMFVNHSTIQRQAISITGTANVQVLWVYYMGTDGTQGKGWYLEEVAQTRSKMAIQNERAKIFGVSTMKLDDGTLATTSSLVDPQTGMPIIAGDGIENQIAGGNVVFGQGVDGQPVITDYLDLMATLQQKGNMVTGYQYLYMTGTVGFFNFQTQAVAHLGDQNVQIMLPVNDKGEKVAGGPELEAGYTFMKINFAGNSVVVVQHPVFDDPYFASEIGANGKSILSATLFVMPINGMTSGSPNMEVCHSAAFGVNRAMVEATLNGMTGSPEMILSQEDAKTYAVLKEDQINVYNTQICAIMYPGPNY